MGDRALALGDRGAAGGRKRARAAGAAGGGGGAAGAAGAARASLLQSHEKSVQKAEWAFSLVVRLPKQQFDFVEAAAKQWKDKYVKGTAHPDGCSCAFVRFKAICQALSDQLADMASPLTLTPPTNPLLTQVSFDARVTLVAAAALSSGAAELVTSGAEYRKGGKNTPEADKHKRPFVLGFTTNLDSILIRSAFELLSSTDDDFSIKHGGMTGQGPLARAAFG